MGLLSFSVDVDANGTARVLLDGQDVSDRIAGVNVAARPGQPPVLTLLHAGEGPIEGEGIVRVVEEGLDQREAVLAFLSNLDAAEVDRQALEKMQWGSKSLTATVIEVLKEAVGGGA